MAILNEKNSTTEKVIHIMITSLCDRNCPHCCNNQYDLNSIPYVTQEELSKADTICLTGGEPFIYSNPCEIASKLKGDFPNIKNVYVYSNAYELMLYMSKMKYPFHSIDGITVSIKDHLDEMAFKRIINHDDFIKLSSNLLYVFPGFENVPCPKSIPKIKRVWQEDFVAAPDSIFRKL